MTIGNRIKRRREELGISVEEVAKRLGKHRATIYRYESDEIRTLPTDVLEPLATVLETTPAALMGYESINSENNSTGQRIKARRKELGLSAEKVADVLGVSPATIYRYENGDIEKVPGDSLEPIARILCTTPAALMGWEEPELNLPDNILPLPNTYTVPLIGTIACGQPITAVQEDTEQVPVPEYIHADFALRCKGDSMINARIFDGDVVYIRQQEEVENGEIAAVMISDTAEMAEATLKRVYRSEGQLILQAENPSFAPIMFVGEALKQVRILGKAVAFISPVK